MRHFIIFLLLIPIDLLGQIEVTLTVENQYGDGNSFFFDIFLTRTSAAGSGDVYLGNSDFVLNFNDANFQAPTVQKEGSSPGYNSFKPTDSNPTNDLITQINYFDNATANVINDQIVINLNGPSPSDESSFNSRVAKIDANSSVHRLGRFRITGISNPSGTAGLTWQTSGNGLKTKVQSLDHMSPFNTTEITVNAINPSDAALPVNLISFKAQIVDKQKSKLIWQTASEINNEGFSIERKNGTLAWTKIGFVPGKGSSSQKASYEFIDPAPILALNYYRLAQIDFDGTINYSHIESLNFTRQQKFRAYPNPVRQVLNIDGLDKTPFLIYDGQGTLYQKGILMDQSIDVSGLTPGIYLLFIDTEPIKFIKW
ncbi:MAG: T9SS type A sorting domain-containing protein [Saprospiraceae bacterium]|nr:T9SS type A sorting domain-containing protein [Saprospiraceae bacterium]